MKPCWKKGFNHSDAFIEWLSVEDWWQRFHIATKPRIHLCDFIHQVGERSGASWERALALAHPALDKLKCNIAQWDLKRYMFKPSMQTWAWGVHPSPQLLCMMNPIGSMYALYGNIYHQYTPNVSIYHTWILWEYRMILANEYKYILFV